MKLLIAVVMLNTVTQWVFIVALLRRAYGNRLELQWRTTFFGQARHGFDVIVWEHNRNHATTNYGKTVFGVNWRSPKTIPDYPYIKNAKKWALPSLLA